MVDEPGIEPVVPAGAVEVVMGVDGEDVVAGKLFGRLADVADPQAGVYQRGGRAAFDQEAVHVHGLADEKHARFQLPGGEPVGHSVIPRFLAGLPARGQAGPGAAACADWGLMVGAHEQVVADRCHDEAGVDGDVAVPVRPEGAGVSGRTSFLPLSRHHIPRRPDARPQAWAAR